jgi:hypothetical protein
MSLPGRTSAADALAPLKQLHKAVPPRIDDRSVVPSDAVLAGGTCPGVVAGLMMRQDGQ